MCKENHFASVCKSTKPVGSNNAISEDTEDPSTNGALQFLALHHSSQDSTAGKTAQDSTAAGTVPDSAAGETDHNIPTQPAHLAAIVQDMKQSGCQSVNTIPLPHMLHQVHAGWVKSKPQQSPNVLVNIRLHTPSYKSLGLITPKVRGRRTWPRSVTKSSIMDSGAQMNVCIDWWHYCGDLRRK